jgi:hypothetical protein
MNISNQTEFKELYELRHTLSMKIRSETLTNEHTINIFIKNIIFYHHFKVPSSRMNDQSKIPAAMRTSLMFGVCLHIF